MNNLWYSSSCKHKSYAIFIKKKIKAFNLEYQQKSNSYHLKNPISSSESSPLNYLFNQNKGISMQIMIFDMF